MKLSFKVTSFVPFLCLSAAVSLAAEVPATASVEPAPRPRLTDALRAKAEREQSGASDGVAVKMDKVVVREARLPSAPPKEQERDGHFSITQGGHVLKKRGDKFTTEVGLWRHIDIIDDPRDQLRQSERVRMSFLRLSW